MAIKAQVDAYEKVVNGRTVSVKAHERNNAAIAQAVADDPTRPPVAGKAGTFAMGRSVPHIWMEPQELDVPVGPPPLTEEDHQKTIDDTIDDEEKQSQISKIYGVSSKASKTIHAAMKMKKELKDGKK